LVFIAPKASTTGQQLISIENLIRTLATLVISLNHLMVSLGNKNK